MKWLRRFGRSKAPTPPENMMSMYQQSYEQTKVAIISQLIDLLNEQHPELTSEDARKTSVIASYLMTAEPENPRVHTDVDPTLRSIATELSSASLTASSELRGLASHASQLVAFMLLGRSVNQQDLSIDETGLRQAEICIDNAIRWGDQKAMYYSTAAQINMSWRRFPRAYELATRAVEEEPTNAEAVRMKGMAAYANGRLEEAIELLERARTLYPGLEGVNEPLAMLYSETGRT